MTKLSVINRLSEHVGAIVGIGDLDETNQQLVDTLAHYRRPAIRPGRLLNGPRVARNKSRRPRVIVHRRRKLVRQSELLQDTTMDIPLIDHGPSRGDLRNMRVRVLQMLPLTHGLNHTSSEQRHCPREGLALDCRRLSFRRAVSNSSRWLLGWCSNVGIHTQNCKPQS